MVQLGWTLTKRHTSWRCTSGFHLRARIHLPNFVPANGSTVVGIIFAPKTLGVEMATLNISDNAAGNPHTLALTGTGVAPAILPLSPVNFGNVNVGATSSPITVTVTNSGSAPLHITSMTFGGANAGEFSTSTAIPIVVDPNNGTATIVVRFSPISCRDSQWDPSAHRRCGGESSLGHTYRHRDRGT